MRDTTEQHEAEIAVEGYVARKHVVEATGPAGGDAADSGFLEVPETSADVQRLYAGDVSDLGYVMNLSRVWAHQPTAQDGLSALMGQAVTAGGLTLRQQGILVAACASAMGDSYCSLAWGKRLAGEVGADLAGDVLRGDDDGLDEADGALAGWARQVARDPNGTALADVQALRDAGFDDGQIFAVTLFVALRIAFSTVNDALGALPDPALADSAPAPVRDAVTFGRPVGHVGQSV
jgi:alkylhydroperoxidase family enzyme